MGCNEVPKAGGGTYWCDDGSDSRDYKLEGDENETIKRAILADTIDRLARMNLLKEDKVLEEVLDYVMQESERKGSIIRDAQLMDLLEFGRMIHAEMSAISDAARMGVKILGATLFCTTFPCHICAKHIVAAGLKRVVYVEPFPKSYAEQLHSDSIQVTSKPTEVGNKVAFSPFIGVSPFRFRDLFERGRRKGPGGRFSEWQDGKPKPIVIYTIATYLENERAITKLFETKMLRLKESGHISVA